MKTDPKRSAIPSPTHAVQTPKTPDATTHPDSRPHNPDPTTVKRHLMIISWRDSECLLSPGQLAPLVPPACLRGDPAGGLHRPCPAQCRPTCGTPRDSGRQLAEATPGGAAIEHLSPPMLSNERLTRKIIDSRERSSNQLKRKSVKRQRLDRKRSRDRDSG